MNSTMRRKGRADACCGGPRPLAAARLARLKSNAPDNAGVEDQLLPGCAEVPGQGPGPCLPEGSQGVVQDAWVQAQGQDDLLLSKRRPRFEFASLRSFVRLSVDTILELADGRAECLRVAGNTKRRSFPPS